MVHLVASHLFVLLVFKIIIDDEKFCWESTVEVFWGLVCISMLACTHPSQLNGGGQKGGWGNYSKPLLKHKEGPSLYFLTKTLSSPKKLPRMEGRKWIANSINSRLLTELLKIQWRWRSVLCASHQLKPALGGNLSWEQKNGNLSWEQKNGRSGRAH